MSLYVILTYCVIVTYDYLLCSAEVVLMAMAVVSADLPEEDV